MRSLFRRSSRALAICGLLLASQALVVTSPKSGASDTSCAALKAWARVYEGASPTLDQLASLDRPHRLAVFSAVTPDVRAALWREQLRRYEGDADLTPAQRALVAEGRALITPGIYARDAAARDAFQQFWTRASRSFATSDQRRAWHDLGAVAGAAPAAAKPAKTQANWCGCSTASAAYDCGGPCIAGGCDGYTGCGAIGQHWCNGTCG